MDTRDETPIVPLSKAAKAAGRALVWAWVASFLGPLSPAFLLILLVGMIACLKRRAMGPLVVLLLCNPLAVHFFGGVLDYWGGSPELRTMGLLPLSNIDRTTRCRITSGGCVVWGHEWVSQIPHNLAILFMAKVLGPPRHAYDGPYPTEDEALQLVRNGTVTPVEVFLMGKVRVKGEEIALPQESLNRTLAQLHYSVPLQEGRPLPPLKIQAVLHEQRCLILRFIETDPSMSAPGTMNHFALLDLQTMQVFAVYRNRWGDKPSP